jgi:hypothetical protein
MAETYTTMVARIQQRLKARGVPSDQALNMAEKQASAKRKRANPGQKGKLGKRNQFKKSTDPQPPKEKKPMRKEDIKTFALNMLMEMPGITGLIASPPAGSTSSGDVGSTAPSSGGAPLSAKYANKDNDDPTKVSGKSGKAVGFKSTGGLKARVTRAKAGSVTKAPDSFTKAESIEEEFGIK